MQQFTFITCFCPSVNSMRKGILYLLTLSMASQATDKQVDKKRLSTVLIVDIFLQPIHDIYFCM